MCVVIWSQGDSNGDQREEEISGRRTLTMRTWLGSWNVDVGKRRVPFKHLAVRTHRVAQPLVVAFSSKEHGATPFLISIRLLYDVSIQTVVHNKQTAYHIGRLFVDGYKI